MELIPRAFVPILDVLDFCYSDLVHIEPMNRPIKAAGPKKVREQSAAARGGQVQSLARAISLLNSVAATEDGISLSDVARQVGLAPSTAHRLLTTLQHERFVRFDASRSVWHIGVQAFAVGNAFVRTRNLVALAQPHMRRLMEESGETVSLAVEDQGQVVFLSQVECRQMMRALAPAGARASMHCSGVGKALLAALPDQRRNDILKKQTMEKFTQNTLTDSSKLLTELATIRAKGYAVDDEEHAVGLRCVAAAIHDETGIVVAGVSLSGPAARVRQDRLDSLGAMVIKTAENISLDYGGVPFGRSS